jgi:hypothetical protein
MAIATFVVSVREFEHPLVFAVLVQREESVKSDNISALKLFLRF